MKIKTISNDSWNSWFRKPLIFIGFHPLKHINGATIVALAVFDNGICECRNLEDSHHEREQFFRYVVEKYQGAPVNIFNQKTKAIFDQLMARDFDQKGLMYFYLKGSEQDTQRWKKELDCAIRSRNEITSPDNPIQIKLSL